MVVLATKCYVTGAARSRALDSLHTLITDALANLDVSYDIGVRDDDFPSITVEGPDATAARNLLREQWGEITPHFESGESYTGTLERWTEDDVVLDSGREITLSTQALDLGPGSAAQIRTRFGLVQHVPLTFRFDDPPTLATPERDRLYEWTRGPGRVNVNSATRSEVRATVNRAGHAGDIVTVERLGLLEQSIVCREGTDPPGLLASVGEFLPSELLCVVP